MKIGTCVVTLVDKLATVGLGEPQFAAKLRICSFFSSKH